MFCKNCGARIEENKKFCPNCGTMINSDNKQEVNDIIEPIKKEEVNIVMESDKIEENIGTNDIKEEPSNVNDASLPVNSLNYTGSTGPSFFYKGIVLCTGICSIIAIILILKGFTFNSILSYFKFLQTIIYIFILGTLNVVYSKLYEKDQYKSLSVFGMFVSTITCAMFLLQVWEIINIKSEGLIKLIYSMAIISAAICHASFILTLDIKNDLVEKFSSAAKILIVLTYGFLIFNVFVEISNEFYLKVFLITIILTAFTTIATPLLNRAD